MSLHYNERIIQSKKYKQKIKERRNDMRFLGSFLIRDSLRMVNPFLILPIFKKQWKSYFTLTMSIFSL
jgi:hypothetical protein